MEEKQHIKPMPDYLNNEKVQGTTWQYQVDRVGKNMGRVGGTRLRWNELDVHRKFRLT